MKPKHLERLQHFTSQTGTSETLDSNKTSRTTATNTLTTSGGFGTSTEKPPPPPPPSGPIGPVDRPVVLAHSPRRLSNSNCYASSERTLLTWLNQAYEHARNRDSWAMGTGAGSLDERRVINFDTDLSDSVVLAAIIGLHIPALISLHLHELYLRPSTKEQKLHNAIHVVAAIRTAHLDFDIRPTDLTNPHPIAMMLLCLHLFYRLPDYVAQQTILFKGPLRTTCKRVIQLSNPTHTPLVFHCFILGRDRTDFTCHTMRSDARAHRVNAAAERSQLDDGHVTSSDVLVDVTAKSNTQLLVEYRPRFLRTTEATFFAVSNRCGAMRGRTLVFNLSGKTNGLGTLPISAVSAPCYELKELTIPVHSPYAQTANFAVNIYESTGDVFIAMCQAKGLDLPPGRVAHEDWMKDEERADDGTDSPSEYTTEANRTDKSPFVGE
ncbi:unnamed protein product [Echinostoma caproni]|uniref:Calponin-homology (CH) domain-containing protein n=1 Tax=Echinostoma caproni TaxID=27848 RepID=A0A3P8HBN9_9TREM|nr:unnamed protein product [Echinostoma caproni]